MLLLGRSVWAGERDTLPGKADRSVSLYSQRIHINSSKFSLIPSPPPHPRSLGMRLGISDESAHAILGGNTDISYTMQLKTQSVAQVAVTATPSDDASHALDLRL